MDTIIATVSQGFIWGILAMGVYITFRILNFADMTAEASLTLGGATGAMLITNEVNPVIAIIVSALAGSLAGLITAFLHTKLKIQAILSGILTMIALYSINLKIMGKANVSLLNKKTIFLNSNGIFESIIICSILLILLNLFFKTNLGLAIRATGDNEQMMRSQGANTNKKKIIALMIGNAFCAFSGIMIAQKHGYADINMGTGAIVIALASIVIGEAIIRKDSFIFKTICVILGSIVYRLIVLAVLNLGLPPNDLKLFTAIVAAILLALPNIKKTFLKRSLKNA